MFHEWPNQAEQVVAMLLHAIIIVSLILIDDASIMLVSVMASMEFLVLMEIDISEMVERMFNAMKFW